jgi:membrane protein HdeD
MMNGVVLIPLLYMLTNATLRQMLISVLLLNLLAFVLGDQWILRETNNSVATIADAAMAGLFFWFVSRYYAWDMSNTELFVVVVALAVVEWMFHKILGKWDRTRTPFSERDFV